MFSNVSENITAAIFKNNAVGAFWMVVGNELKEMLQNFRDTTRHTIESRGHILNLRIVNETATNKKLIKETERERKTKIHRRKVGKRTNYAGCN
jgi:hypothetical protein